MPSPCGPNSQCRVIGNTPACSCLPNYIGRAPNCRPECVISEECPSNLACQNERCVDPCPGSCGANADCTVIVHRSVCSCAIGYTGDPFAGCSLIPSKIRLNSFEPEIIVLKPFQLFNRLKKSVILVIHRRVAQIQFVKNRMEQGLVLVYQIISVIHTPVVDLNVLQTQIARVIELVREINALILAQEPVESMLNVSLQTMRHLATVYRVILEIL